MSLGLAERTEVAGPRVSLRATVRAELRKLTTVRWWWLTVVATVVLGAGSALLCATVDSTGTRTRGQLLAVLNGGNPLVRLVGLAIGVITTSGEYRYRTVLDTYLAVPRRSRVVVAKLITLALIGALIGALNLCVGFAVAALTTSGQFYLSDATTWRSVGLGTISIICWCWMGMGLGLLVRRVGAALLIGVAAAYLVEPTLATVSLLRHWDVLLNLLPTGATNAMLGVDSTVLLSSPHPWPWWAGLVVLATWAVVIAGVGSLVSIRRDV